MSKKEYSRTSTGSIDEGNNETTRLPYSDSISTKASPETLKKKGKKS